MTGGDDETFRIAASELETVDTGLNANVVEPTTVNELARDFGGYRSVESSPCLHI